MLDEGLIETTETADHFCLINNDDIRPHIKRVPTEGDDGVLEATHYTWFWNADYMEEYLQETFPSANIGVRRYHLCGAYNPLILYRKLPNSF